MKRAYTIFSPRLKKYCKEVGLGAQEYFNLFAHHRKTISGFDEHDYVGSVCFGVDHAIMEGQSLHIFLPGLEFCNWIVSCVLRLESIHASVIQKYVGNNNAGVLHFPSHSKLSSLGFWAPEKGEHICGAEAPDYGCLFMSFSVGNVEKLGQASVLLNESAKCSDGIMWYAKLIVGLGMYINCFPEAFSDGVPEDLGHPSMHNYKSTKTVGVSEKISVQGDRENSAAHFRSGHFRVLRSEKFKNKRFQTIFIRETFVNGHAKTVLSPEQC